VPSASPDLFDVRHRFERFAARFAERVRPRSRNGARARSSPAGSDGYWQNVQDLFLQDVTEKGLRELVEHEAQDTFRFFTRDVDLQDLRPRPWFKRWPLSAWRVFLATAFRLSPARRILFALAVPLLWLAWLRYLLSETVGGEAIPSIFGWTLVAATLFCALLLLELRDKLALKSDLEVARQIQFGLLPFEPFERDGIAIRAAMRPANTVGGDYFDVIDLGPGRIAAVIGDVAGKGMPAALLMALLQGSLRTLITAGFRGPELISKLNAHLFANIPSNRLITLFYGELDMATGTFRYVNAGHNPPYRLAADGATERLTPTGMALGIVPSADFEAREARLHPGDRVFLYTDGVTEAESPGDVEYGEPRLEAYLAAGHGASDQELIEGVRADVMSFCGSAPPRDDMTLMVVARRS
jgi:sigma-B regulation protein RsbU (phosphoserine phosphatase)